MGVTKLQAFAGQAEILGEIQGFNFDGHNEVLVVHGVATVDRAMALLDRLSLGTLATVVPKEALRAPRPPAPEPAAGATASSAVPQQYADPAVPAEPAQVQEAVVEGVVVSPAEGFPDEVIQATRMRPVVEYFHNSRGLRTVEEITAACEAAREQIPILGKVQNMQDRVERTLSAYFKTDAPA
jgi:hypothetical protein